MSLRFQRLILILTTLVMLGAALLLILFNTKQNIVFFYTPSELIENKITSGVKVRIGGYVKKSSILNIKTISIFSARDYRGKWFPFGKDNIIIIFILGDPQKLHS